MSVLIINMEMPNTCKACVCSNYYERMDMILCDIMDKQLDEKQWKSERHHDCPLIEVPTPHGSLVDREELIAEYDRQHVGPPGGARKIMEQATAIIKAEPEEVTE